MAKNKNNVATLASRLAHAQLVAVGAANGIGGRSRLQPSGKEKAKRRNRQKIQWQRDW